MARQNLEIISKMGLFEPKINLCNNLLMNEGKYTGEDVVDLVQDTVNELEKRK